MTTADDAVIQSAYDRLRGDDAKAPKYLVAILVSAIPTFSDETPMVSRADWNDGETITWHIVAADRNRLVRITVTGPSVEQARGSDRPLQAAEQTTTITPLTDSITKVAATVRDTTGYRDEGIHWQTVWTIHFADGDQLTVPTQRDLNRYDPSGRDKTDKFVHDFLALALPR